MTTNYQQALFKAEKTYTDGLGRLEKIEQALLKILIHMKDALPEDVRVTLSDVADDLNSPEGLVSDTFGGMRDLALSLMERVKELEGTLNRIRVIAQGEGE